MHRAYLKQMRVVNVRGRVCRARVHKRVRLCTDMLSCTCVRYAQCERAREGVHVCVRAFRRARAYACVRACACVCCVRLRVRACVR
jgi:hypothetical protein